MLIQDANLIRELMLRTEKQGWFSTCAETVEEHANQSFHQHCMEEELGLMENGGLTYKARDILNLIRDDAVWNEAKRRIESSVGTTDWRTWMWTCRLVAREMILDKSHPKEEAT